MKYLAIVLILSSVHLSHVSGQIPQRMTHNGYLVDSTGTPLSGNRPMTFRLYQDSTAALADWTESFTAVTISNGVYSVNLDVSIVDFSKAYWLETQVGSSVLAPRTRLTSVPYALVTNSLQMPFSAITPSASMSVTNTGTTGSAGRFENSNTGNWGIALMALSSGGEGTAVYAEQAGDGFAGTFVASNPGLATAVQAMALGSGSAGQFSINNISNTKDALDVTTNGTGSAGHFEIINSGNTLSGLVSTTSGTGPAATFYTTNSANFNSALRVSSNGTGGGLNCISTGSGGSGTFQIINSSSADNTIDATTNGSGNAGWFYLSNAANGNSAVNSSTEGAGDAVYGRSYGPSGTGVHGIANSGAIAYGVWGQSSSGFAGHFNGDVSIVGTLSKSAGSFKIDHPLDPANKYLSHSFVESPDMMNIYNGNVLLDANGGASIDLPEWFEALNKDFRYQLTAIGGPGPNLHISQKVSGNKFRIAGGSSGMEVSWQVTGIRKDAYAEKHRIPVEEYKPDYERGSYLQPDLFGQPEEKDVEWARRSELMKRIKVESQMPAGQRHQVQVPPDAKKIKQ